MVKYVVMTFMYAPWLNSKNGSHEKLIKIVGDSGAEGIEAFANLFFAKNELVKLYQSEMQKYFLKMPVMDLIADLSAATKSERRQAYENMRRGIDICDGFDSEIIHVAGCHLAAGVSPEDGRKWIAEGLSEFVDDVEKRGMVLAIEDYNPSPKLICSAADCADIIAQTNNRVKFVFDTGNFEEAGEHAEDNFEKMIAKTCHFHFKDFRVDVGTNSLVGTYFGKGFIKNREIAAKIIKYGYTGWVALESYLQDGNGPEETVAKELAELKSLF